MNYRRADRRNRQRHVRTRTFLQKAFFDPLGMTGNYLLAE
jgi:hypothetical protein